MQTLSRQDVYASKALSASALLNLVFASSTGDADAFLLSELQQPALTALSVFRQDHLESVLLLRRARLSYAQEGLQDYVYQLHFGKLRLEIYQLVDGEPQRIPAIEMEVREGKSGRLRLACMPNTALDLSLSMVNQGAMRALRVGGQLVSASGLCCSSAVFRSVSAFALADFLTPEELSLYLPTEDPPGFTLDPEAAMLLATATEQPKGAQDQRWLGFGLSADVDGLSASLGRVLQRLEEGLSTHPAYFNQLHLHCLAPIDDLHNFQSLVNVLVQQAHYRLFSLGVTQLSISCICQGQDWALEASGLLDGAAMISDTEPAPLRLNPATRAQKRELKIRLRGGIWAYRIPALLRLVQGEFCRQELGRADVPALSFTELDLDYHETVIHPSTGSIDPNYGELIPVQRAAGANEAGVVIGILQTDLGLAQPLRRMLIIGDLSHPSRGSLRGQECVRINAAIRYASKQGLPIDWFAASFGVQIHHERGVEGLDAAASTLRELVHHCHQRDLQVNFVVDAANIGAQSYWDSMAAILYQTSGILIMTPKGSMALTGAKSLACALFGTINSEKIQEYVERLYPDGLQSLSGGRQVHAPNAECMVFSDSLEQACYKLTLHHYYAYLDTGELLCGRRRLNQETQAFSQDLVALEKAIFSFLSGQKPDRECVIDAIRDAQSPTPLPLWQDTEGTAQQALRSGDLPQTASAIVRELLIGGHPTMMIFTPTGPLTPADSNIIARAINKASGRMQVLIIGSLSGFSCDPLSMANRQLQEGAMIAKAIVEHDGPLLVVNLGALVGGTFVVFNKQLSPNLRILAVEGARVQVIGGKSAAKVVFHSSIKRQATQDERVLKADQQRTGSAMDQRMQQASGRSLQQLRSSVIEEIEDEEADRFDRFHNARRALKVGSIDEIVAPKQLRQSIINYFEQMRLDYSQRKPKREDVA